LRVLLSSELDGALSKTTMGNRLHIPEAVKEQIVVMSVHLRLRKIAKVTGISRRTVDHVLELARRTGRVVRRPLQNGRPRTLKGVHAEVRICLLP
jgi:transposase